MRAISFGAGAVDDRRSRRDRRRVGGGKMRKATATRDLMAKVFPDRELKYVALGAGGKLEVRVV